MERLEYDLVVIGGGSGGYAAARTARDLGKSVAIVDPGPLGGLCILRGCMPSKTLLASSDAAHEVRSAAALGVHAGEPRIDFRAVMARKAEIIKGFADYRVEQLETFPILHGRARFLSESAIVVDDRCELRARAFVVATGSVVAPPVVHGLADVGFIDSDRALELDAPPRSLVVLGGGYVACELGQFFARMGTNVTMLIRSDQLLTSEDADVGGALTDAFRREGIRVETGVRLERCERRHDRKAVVFIQDGVEREAVAEEIFYALGRVPNIDGLDLERAGVRAHAMTGIEVGDDLRTTNPHVFAVGDVTGRFPLVHVAIYQGEVAARNAMLGTREHADYTLQRTHTVFTDPQVAVAGMTEKELAAAGRRFIAASYPFADHGKAIAIEKTTGFVKMVADSSDGRILGAAIVGAHASDLIHEVVVAMHFGATAGEFAKIPHLHPTMAEILTYPAEELAALVVPPVAVVAG